MSYYHFTKEEALEEGSKRFEGRWSVRAELEPSNGWVIVISPLSLDYLREPLEPLLAYAEIRIDHTIRRRPSDYKKPVARSKIIKKASSRAPAVTLEGKAQMPKPWECAATPQNEPPKPRKAPVRPIPASGNSAAPRAKFPWET